MGSFGDFVLDAAARELRRGGELVHLEPQAFDLLVVLVAERHRVVPKAELLDTVWGDQFVSESALTTRIKELRRATGDDGVRQEVIANARGRGYRFVADYRDGPAPGAAPAARAAPGAGLGLVGRADDVAAIVERLAPATLVTVVGPGGAGKTAIAREVLRAAGLDRVDGVHVVELADLATPDAVLLELARTVGVTSEGDDRRRIARAVAGLDALVLLDNCEHLVGPVAQLLDDLLRPGARVRLLATSRERLGLSAERVWPLLPLDPADARALFCERARAAAPGLADDELAEGTVDRIVERLDRLPLAIEMAAARLGAMRVDELAALVDGGLGRLRSPHRQAPVRHRTLAALVEWSVDLLEEHDARLLEAVSTFAGTFTVADAAAVVADAPSGGAEGEVLDGLVSLVERSLLVCDRAGPNTRYRVFETVREHARERAATDGRAAVDRHRHARRARDLAAAVDAQIRTDDEPAGHHRMTEVRAELRAAVRWAATHEPELAVAIIGHLHLYAYGRLWGEPAAWARELLAADGGAAAVPARVVVAADAAHTGALAESRALLQPGLAADDPLVRAGALEVLADLAFYEGDLDEAAAAARAIEQIGVAQQDRHLVAMSGVIRSLAATYRGDPAAGLRLLDQLDGPEPLGPSDAAWRVYARGEALASTAPDEAAACLEEAAHLAAGVDHRFIEGVAQLALAALAARGDDPASALEPFRAVLLAGRRRGNLTHAVTAVRNVVELLFRLDRPEPAVRLLGALEVEGVRPTYGEEQARLDTALAAVRAGVGSATVARWTDEGRHEQQGDVVGLALAEVDALLAERRTST